MNSLKRFIRPIIFKTGYHRVSFVSCTHPIASAYTGLRICIVYSRVLGRYIIGIGLHLTFVTAIKHNARRSIIVGRTPISIAMSVIYALSHIFKRMLFCNPVIMEAGSDFGPIGVLLPLGCVISNGFTTWNLIGCRWFKSKINESHTQLVTVSPSITGNGLCIIQSGEWITTINSNTSSRVSDNLWRIWLRTTGWNTIWPIPSLSSESIFEIHTRRP